MYSSAYTVSSTLLQIGKQQFSLDSFILIFIHAINILLDSLRNFGNRIFSGKISSLNQMMKPTVTSVTKTRKMRTHPPSHREHRVFQPHNVSLPMYQTISRIEVAIMIIALNSTMNLTTCHSIAVALKVVTRRKKLTTTSSQV